MKKMKREDIPSEIENMIGDIEHIHYPRQGYTSIVGILETSNGKFALKMTSEEQFNHWLDHEINILKLIQDNGLFKVPKVYYYHREDQKRYALLEAIEGETLRSVLDIETNEKMRRDLIYQFGHVLKQIHSLPCSKALIKEKCWIDIMIDQAEHNFKNNLAEGTGDQLMLLKKNKPIDEQETFIHGDFTIDNVLVHNNQLKAVIDWSGGAIGDPRYDIALAIRQKNNLFESKADLEAFYSGYGLHHITKEEYIYFNHLYDFF